jgi:hypothetical protein
MIFRCSLNLSCFARLEGDGYGVVSAKELIRVLKFVDGNVFVLDRQDRNHAAHERGPCQFFSTHGGRDQVSYEIVHSLLHRVAVGNLFAARHQSWHFQFAYLIGCIVIDHQVESCRHLEGFSIQRGAVF